MRYLSNNRAWPVALLLAILLAAPSQSFAAPIGAKAVFVQGVAHVISIATGKKTRIAKGASFVSGDKIITSRTGIVEIRFDNGDKIRIDRSSSLLVKELRRDSSGSTFSVFNLFFGRVKSAVGKLATKSSKFEYHTKAAIAGVAGTPDWILEMRGETLKAYLLGEPGDEGVIYLLAFDPMRTIVHITAGTWSSTNAGMAPSPPKLISNAIRKRLKRLAPFQSDGEDKGGDESSDTSKKEEKKSDDKKEKQTDGQKIVTDNISRKVSSPKAASLDESKGQQGVNYMTTPQQGAIGQESQTGDQGTPPVATFNVKINFR